MLVKYLSDRPRAHAESVREHHVDRDANGLLHVAFDIADGDAGAETEELHGAENIGESKLRLDDDATFVDARRSVVAGVGPQRRKDVRAGLHERRCIGNARDRRRLQRRIATGESAGQATGFDTERMMLDANGVYLLRSDPTITLIRAPFDGGSVVDVTTDGVLAYEIADETIYWATFDADSTVKLKSMPKYVP